MGQGNKDIVAVPEDFMEDLARMSREAGAAKKPRKITFSAWNAGWLAGWVAGALAALAAMGVEIPPLRDTVLKAIDRGREGKKRGAKI